MTLKTLFRLAAAALIPLTLGAASRGRTDWTTQVAATGVGVRMGNPAATTRLVEYGSFNCPHCAAFAKVADADIRRLVRSGRINFEFRPKLIFPHDPPATAIARCVGPTRFFAFTADYMANAPAVGERLQAAEEADADFLAPGHAGGRAAMARKIARVGAMAPIAARHGLSPGALDRCLGNAAVLARVEANEQAALKAGVTGTPTFFLNGKRAEFADLQKLGIAADAH